MAGMKALLLVNEQVQFVLHALDKNVAQQVETKASLPFVITSHRF